LFGSDLIRNLSNWLQYGGDYFYANQYYWAKTLFPGKKEKPFLWMREYYEDMSKACANRQLWSNEGNFHNKKIPKHQVTPKSCQNYVLTSEAYKVTLRDGLKKFREAVEKKYNGSSKAIQAMDDAEKVMGTRIICVEDSDCKYAQLYKCEDYTHDPTSAFLFATDKKKDVAGKKECRPRKQEDKDFDRELHNAIGEDIVKSFKEDRLSIILATLKKETLPLTKLTGETKAKIEELKKQIGELITAKTEDPKPAASTAGEDDKEEKEDGEKNEVGATVPEKPRQASSPLPSEEGNDEEKKDEKKDEKKEE
jgi:hypothetical protein